MMRERTSRNNQGSRKGEEVTVWRGALCLIYTKVLCLFHRRRNVRARVRKRRNDGVKTGWRIGGC